MSHFLNILCCFVSLGELHLCNACVIKQVDTFSRRNIPTCFANDIYQSYCFCAIKLICRFVRNFFREIYVCDTTGYSARHCTKEMCTISAEYEYFFREISIGDLIGNFSCYCAREIRYGDTGGHYCAKAIWWYFARIHISLMQYHLTNFTTQTINYTYDKLNQLTSVSNYGNLGLKDVYQYDLSLGVEAKN